MGNRLSDEFGRDRSVAGDPDVASFRVYIHRRNKITHGNSSLLFSLHIFER